MNGQSKSWSLTESLINTFIGFWISVTATFIVLPIYLGVPIAWHENLVITAIFTGISVVRSYILRRCFNWIHVKRGHLCPTGRRKNSSAFLVDSPTPTPNPYP